MEENTKNEEELTNLIEVYKKCIKQKEMEIIKLKEEMMSKVRLFKNFSTQTDVTET